MKRNNHVTRCKKSRSFRKIRCPSKFEGNRFELIVNPELALKYKMGILDELVTIKSSKMLAKVNELLKNYWSIVSKPQI